MLVRSFQKGTLDSGAQQAASSRQFAFRLVDATAEVGIKSVHVPSDFAADFTNVMPYLQAVGASVSVVDAAGDGWYDIYLTTSQKGGHNSYYRNNRDGTFSEIAEQIGLADVNRPYPSWRSVFYDFDRDGAKDLLLFSYCPRLFRNAGSQGYVEIFGHGVPCGLHYGGVNALEVGRTGRISFVVSPYLSVDLFNPKTTKVFPNSFSNESNGAAIVFLENIGGFKFASPDSANAKKRGFLHRGWGHAIGVYDFGGRGLKDVWFPQDYSYERFYRNDGQDYFAEEMNFWHVTDLVEMEWVSRLPMSTTMADQSCLFRTSIKRATNFQEIVFGSWSINLTSNLSNRLLFVASLIVVGHGLVALLTLKTTAGSTCS
ncbi:MAG: VCBS repeat-containing protein [Bdellovibrionales bacterium]|nr:VCBS repeat-containing protein [Bdellovibrionales bacterium]